MYRHYDIFTKIKIINQIYTLNIWIRIFWNEWDCIMWCGLSVFSLIWFPCPTHITTWQDHTRNSSALLRYYTLKGLFCTVGYAVLTSGPCRRCSSSAERCCRSPAAVSSGHHWEALSDAGTRLRHCSGLLKCQGQCKPNYCKGASLFTTIAEDKGGLTQECRCEEVILVLSVVIVQRGAVLLKRRSFESVVVPVVLVILVVILVLAALARCHVRLQLHCTAVLIHLVFIAWDLLCQSVKK